MLLNKNWLTNNSGGNTSTDDARERILEVLGHRYVRESQHVMRFRQHAARIADSQVHEALLRMAAEEAEHVRWIEEKIASLGGKLPVVIEVHYSHENVWEYLRSDLDDERRCMAEIEDDKENLQSEFPDIVRMLDRIEADAEKNWQEIRSLLLRDAAMVPLAA
jgi:rubrerythrin